ncbi:UNVERIFIED_CONTAM: hypothetical protein Slati_0147700 [Sesamum latifolium]|uniref:Uncharacterized protein n=1 Tax=Sesamum latifolium TaxID=2727402 RepID=A0AAW2YA79_9LAMI
MVEAKLVEAGKSVMACFLMKLVKVSKSVDACFTTKLVMAKLVPKQPVLALTKFVEAILVEAGEHAL